MHVLLQKPYSLSDQALDREHENMHVQGIMMISVLFRRLRN